MIQNALLAGVPVFSCDLFCSLTLIKLSTLCRISYLSNSTYLISTFTFTGFGSTHVRSETTFSTLHCKCQNNLFFLLLGPITHTENSHSNDFSCATASCFSNSCYTFNFKHNYWSAWCLPTFFPAFYSCSESFTMGNGRQFKN